MQKPLVSVIVPTHNGACWLPESIGSVLRQTYTPTEIIVVDDGSTDETPAVLRQFQPRIAVIRQSRGDIGAARNRGMAQARGDYLAFLDHDDVWREDKLAIQVDYLVRHPEIDVLHADAVEFDNRGTVHESYFALFPGVRRSADIFRQIVGFCVPLMSTVVIKTAFQKAHVLAFPEGTSGVDDVGLLLEIAARGGVFACQKERLARRRLHARNLSKVHWNRFAKRVALYGQLLDRLTDARPEHRRALHWGLRHAHFLTGECFWGDGDRRTAARHFRAAWGWDVVGAQALLYGAACHLPGRTAERLRAAKRAVQRVANAVACGFAFGTNPLTARAGRRRKPH